MNVTIPKSFVLDQWIVTHVSGSSALRQVSTKISGVLNSQVLIFVIVVFKLMYIINKKYASSLKMCYSFKVPNFVGRFRFVERGRMRRSVLFLREVSYHKITGIERATQSEYLYEIVKEGNVSIYDRPAWINV